MEFDVNLNNLDIARAIAYTQVRNKALWAMCIVSSILVNGISVVGLWAMEWPLHESMFVAGDFILRIFILFVICLGLTTLVLLANPKWRKGRVGHHRIEVNETGMVESTEYNRAEIYWPSIRKVSSKPSGLYFLHSGAESFMIPRRSFKSLKEWQDFEGLFFSHYERTKATNKQ